LIERHDGLSDEAELFDVSLMNLTSSQSDATSIDMLDELLIQNL